MEEEDTQEAIEPLGGTMTVQGPWGRKQRSRSRQRDRGRLGVCRQGDQRPQTMAKQLTEEDPDEPQATESHYTARMSTGHRVRSSGSRHPAMVRTHEGDCMTSGLDTPPEPEYGLTDTQRDNVRVDGSEGEASTPEPRKPEVPLFGSAIEMQISTIVSALEAYSGTWHLGVRKDCWDGQVAFSDAGAWGQGHSTRRSPLGGVCACHL